MLVQPGLPGSLETGQLRLELVGLGQGHELDLFSFAAARTRRYSDFPDSQPWKSDGRMSDCQRDLHGSSSRYLGVRRFLEQPNIFAREMESTNEQHSRTLSLELTPWPCPSLLQTSCDDFSGLSRACLAVSGFFLFWRARGAFTSNPTRSFGPVAIQRSGVRSFGKPGRANATPFPASARWLAAARLMTA